MKLCKLKPSENISSQYFQKTKTGLRSTTPILLLLCRGCEIYKLDSSISMPCNYISNSYGLNKVKCHFHFWMNVQHILGNTMVIWFMTFPLKCWKFIQKYVMIFKRRHLTWRVANMYDPFLKSQVPLAKPWIVLIRIF